MPQLWSTIPTRSRSSGRARAGSCPSTDTSPALRVAVALEDLHGRRLAGPVGPEQAEHLAARDLECDPPDAPRASP